MVACVMGYALGARASGLARRFVGEAGLTRAERLRARYGDWTIVMCRPVPVLAEASVIFAGLVGAPFARFVALTALSNLGIAVGYAAFGAFSMSVDSFLVAFLGALIIPGVVMGIARADDGKSRQSAVVSRESQSTVSVGSSSRPVRVRGFGLRMEVVGWRNSMRVVTPHIGRRRVHRPRKGVQAFSAFDQGSLTTWVLRAPMMAPRCP